MDAVSADDASINWSAAFACYGGHGAATRCRPFSIAPGGWAGTPTASTQCIIAGSGGGAGRRTRPVAPAASSCTRMRHDLRNTGTTPLLAVAFFSGEALTQTFDNVMRPSNNHILASPNANGHG